jgi:hypothetical protein
MKTELAREIGFARIPSQLMGTNEAAVSVLSDRSTALMNALSFLVIDAGPSLSPRNTYRSYQLMRSHLVMQDLVVEC